MLAILIFKKMAIFKSQKNSLLNQVQMLSAVVRRHLEGCLKSQPHERNHHTIPFG